jgi:hypothetical protein
MSGRVVIDNSSGHEIHAYGCLTMFQLALVSSSYHPAIAWFDCAQSFTIPRGRSIYPVIIAASYSQCSSARPANATRACLPDGHTPPLPPGRYRAVLFSSGASSPAHRPSSCE